MLWYALIDAPSKRAAKAILCRAIPLGAPASQGLIHVVVMKLESTVCVCVYVHVVPVKFII